jgi:hypothetical protein
MDNNSLFEVETVTHRHDLISFTWKDVGGIYQVYRDEELLYEGTVAEFYDGNFKHAKMYNYSIERLVGDEVVDVIALQTSAFAEQRNPENPLQFLVMTTIVAKSQIALSWEEIKDVDTYEIYRNGIYMQTVKGNRYIDRDFSLDEPYTYRIHSKRPLEKSEERMSRSKSILSNVFERLGQASASAEPAMERYTVSKLIAKPRFLLIPVLKRTHRKNVDYWKFRYATFLAEEFVVNPNPLSKNHIFKGDGRDFQPESERYRTCVNVNLDYPNHRSMTFMKDIGRTIAYDRSGRVREDAVASDEGIVLEKSEHQPGEVGFLLTHAVGNPLVPAPTVDYEVRAVFRRDGTFDMTGFHDQAPHHEIYIIRGEGSEWRTIHLSRSKGLAWMSGVIAWQYWRFSNFE